jgi:Uma2 family endonuclease
MNDSAVANMITTEELLAMPDNGVDRELIRGQLKEKPMTRRNPLHSEVNITIGTFLKLWVKQQRPPRGRVLGGEAGFRIRKHPDTTVGIDVAYISAELAASTPRNAKLVDGVPTLAVEILSPSDQHEEIADKVQEYLDVGVPLVWVVDPIFRTIEVHRPGMEPEQFNMHQELMAEPHLPGFRVALAEIFES